MASPHEEPSATCWSARLEILITVARIAAAINALPSHPDGLTVRRWNHGIARELWILISAVGLEAVSGMTAGSLNVHAPPIRDSLPVQQLFQASTWRYRRLTFNMVRLNLDSYLTAAKACTGQVVLQGMESAFPHWWEWPRDPNNRGEKAPAWWCEPSADVGAPIPMFESDRSDIEAAAGQAYGAIGGVMFDKEFQLQEVERRISELTVAISDCQNMEE